MRTKKKKKENALALREEQVKAKEKIEKEIKEKEVKALERFIKKRDLEGEVKPEKLHRYILEEGHAKAEQVLKKIEEGMNFEHAKVKLKESEKVKKIEEKFGIKGPLAAEIYSKAMLKDGKVTRKKIEKTIKEMVDKGILNKKFLQKAKRKNQKKSQN